MTQRKLEVKVTKQQHTQLTAYPRRSRPWYHELSRFSGISISQLKHAPVDIQVIGTHTISKVDRDVKPFDERSESDRYFSSDRSDEK